VNGPRLTWQWTLAGDGSGLFVDGSDQGACWWLCIACLDSEGAIVDTAPFVSFVVVDGCAASGGGATVYEFIWAPGAQISPPYGTPSGSFTLAAGAAIEFIVDFDQDGVIGAAAVAANLQINGVAAATCVVPAPDDGLLAPALLSMQAFCLVPAVGAGETLAPAATPGAPLYSGWENDGAGIGFGAPAWVPGAGGGVLVSWTGAPAVNFCPPWGPAPVRLRAGGQEALWRHLLPLPAGDTTVWWLTATLWTRTTPDDPWTLQPPVLPTGSGPFVFTTTLTSWDDAVSNLAWFDPPAGDAASLPWPFLGGPYLLNCTQQCVDAADNAALAVAVDVSGGLERLTARTYHGGDVTVADGVRQAGDSGARPYPWCDRLGDGTWRVGCFAAGRYGEWRSTDALGLVWAAYDTQTLGSDADLACANHWRGAAEDEAVAGYHQAGGGAGGDVRLWHRGSFEKGAWQGPVVVATLDTAVSPYVLQRSDGWWEVGWRLGDAWRRFRSASRGGPWEET
jgi:hypothetical protein